MKLLALLAIFLALPLACSHVQPFVGPTVDCAAIDIAPYFSRVVADLTTSNFADLDALALSQGVDFVACCIKAFTSKTGTGPAVKNGHEWLKAHDAHFTS